MNRELYITAIAAIALLVYGCNSMALKSEDPKERMAAVQQIDDQDDLLDIALNEEYSDDVRLAATAKMEKPHALWRVWCFSTNKADIAAKALSRISDNDYLARIAMLAPYEESKEEIEAREKKGITQQKLADMSGMKQSAIARIEKLSATPKIDTMIRLLKPLG